MSKRHTLVTLVLLSSSTAFAKPAKHPSIAKLEKIEQRAGMRFRIDCDSDGFPMVGNVKGKVGGGDRDDAITHSLAALDPHYLSRIFSR